MAGQRSIQANPKPVEDVALLRAELLAVQAQLDAVTRELRSDRERDVARYGEMQYRARNVVAIIRSIFSRTMASGGVMEDVADHFRGRLEVLARYQQSRISNPTGMLDLDLMLRDELRDFHFGDDPRIAISGDAVQLPHDQAQSLGLALHELVTNALKFGALAHVGGRLRVAWRLHGTSLTLDWTETGVPILAVAPLHYGFGREAIEQGLPYQMGATTTFALRPGGLQCRITFDPGIEQPSLPDEMA